MEIKFHKSHSGVIPPLLDTTSSKTSVYIRKNVTEVKVKDPWDGSMERTEYEYDEAILSKQEYEMFQIQLNAEEAIAELAELVLGSE